MKTVKISKTVFPANKPKDFNEWSMWFFGCYKMELEKIKQGWDKNIYIPKKQL